MSLSLETISTQQDHAGPPIWNARTFAPTYPALELVDELVARTFRQPKSALHASTRCRKSVAFARQVAMYLGHVCLSYPIREVAEHYGRDRTTVSYACRVVEDRREYEETELLLNSLESALQTMMLVTPLTCRRQQ